MSKKDAGLGDNTGAVLTGGVIALALLLVAYLSFGGEGIAPSQRKAAVPEPQTDAAKPAIAPPEETIQMPAAVMMQAPRFDEVRREPDGTTIIAGRAEPLSDVKILLDGAQVATAQADTSGGFAAIAMLPPQQSAQVISLLAQDAQGTQTAMPSVDEIILAPRAAVTHGETAQVGPVTRDEEVQSTPAVAPNIAQDGPAVAGVAPQLRSPSAAPAAVAVLKSDARGVSLLSDARPQVMTSVTLDTIGYSEGGDVQLSGRAQPNTAQVRVYLDNFAVISLPVDAQGKWRGDLPDVDEGIYTLRVDELDDQGAVSSRVETPFRRESAQALAKAAAASEGPVKSVTVQAGATLWAIARERYGDGLLYVRVFEANADSIRDPDLIYPGQVFDLPN